VLLHSGVISDDGEILSGVYRETLWGLTPEPLVMLGEFRLTRPSHLPPQGQPVELQISAAPVWLAPSASATVTTRLLDFYSNPISQTQVTFSASVGTLTPPTATTDMSGEALVTYTAGEEPGWATITATSGATVGVMQVQIVPYNHIYLPLVLRNY
jgi:hypothetical protein